MTRHLERLLSRWEYGKLAPELLEIELRAVLHAAGDAALELQPQTATIRLWNPELLSARTDRLRDADRSINMLDFRQAVRLIRQCETVLTSTRELLHAVAAADEAEASATRVHDLAAVPRLRKLPAVASLAQITDISRQYIIERDYLRASFIAEVCARLAASLCEQQPCTGDGLNDRLIALENLCTATHPVAEPEDDPLGDHSIATLRELRDDGYGRLAERLLTELEVQTAGRRRFLLHCGQIADPDEARVLVRNLTWDGAVDYYWQRSVSGYAVAAEQQRLRLAEITAGLDAALTQEQQI